MVDQRWTNLYHPLAQRWNQWLGPRNFIGGRSVVSPLAGVDVGATLAEVDVGPMLTHHWNQWLAQPE